MFKKTAIITGIALAMSAGAQADYDWELGAGYTAGKLSKELKSNGQTSKVNTDTDEIDVSATWYMETVDTSKGPLGEAAFLDHASNITIEIGDGKVELANQNNDDGQTYEASMRYVAEGPGWKLSGWLVDLSAKRSEPANLKIDQYSIGVGKYITENTTLVLNYENTSLNNGNGSGLDTYGGSVDHFFAFGDGGLKAEVNFARTYVPNRDDVDSYGLDATYYLSNNLGFGVNWEQLENSGNETNVYGVSAEWFISESFAVSLSYQDITPEDVKYSNGDKLESYNESLSMSGLFRF
ncbi:MAG: hypothetical protein OSA77_10710 [Halioglobus sp.]|jgi:hypothetical protein|nr:hypothetical protein [Halioglobus sp.]